MELIDPVIGIYTGISPVLANELGRGLLFVARCSAEKFGATIKTKTVWEKTCEKECRGVRENRGKNVNICTFVCN